MDRLLERYQRCDDFGRARAAFELPRGRLGGLAGGSVAFVLAALWDETRTGPCLLVTESPEAADALLDDLEAFAPGRVMEFPAWESLFLEDSEPEGETYQARVSVLDAIARGEAKGRFIVCPVHALVQPVPRREVLESSVIVLEQGADYPMAELAERLVRLGLESTSLVERPGELSVRGDILDLFPWSRSRPIRLEFFGDTLESIREFDPVSQRSVARDLRSARLAFPSRQDVFKSVLKADDDALLVDWIDADGLVVLVEEEEVEDRAHRIIKNMLEERSASTAGRFHERLQGVAPRSVSRLPLAEDERSVNLEMGSVERFRGRDLDRALELILEARAEGTNLTIFCETPADRRRLSEVLEERGAEPSAELRVEEGPLRSGFEIPSLREVVLSSRELYHRHLARKRRSATRPPSKAIQSFLELERGDYVVHLTYGIGRYLGIEVFEKEGIAQELLHLEFRGGTKIYVPVSKIDLVQKYIGAGDRPPILDKVGGTSWDRKKETVENALLCMASELLQIQAARQERPGIAFPPDGEWQRRFELSFPFEDTPDQVEVTEAIKRDMESPRPMDRLICGDVGYGKTELAMRAAFKTATAGRQVAVLVPTTVLAEQHFRTFRARMEEFPVRIEVLSRFRTAKRQREILAATRRGEVDILIGTHRLLSGDVEFRDLGLLVVDEEQRFGVAHKERLKKLRREVDVLTLSATPIPRTLHMALLGIRDIANLTTPPAGRSPIHTEISRFDRRKTREIIVRELNRDGQVLFIHNRIADLPRLKTELDQIVPEARTEFAHGQMKESALEAKMLAFLSGEIDVLIATTIVENGIDVPSANTIIISEADLYGLADLHQMRGRVGRSSTQAYCYLFLPEHRHVNPEARKRLQALVEFSGLGAGFQIAMRDLELRGAGNILGKEQSGHIAAVGYDMYCRLLEKCVRELEKKPTVEPVAVEIDLTVDARIPDGFLRGESEKIELYRRVSQLADADAVAELLEELEDRYGECPPSVRRLLDVQKMRLLCRDYGVVYVGHEDDNLLVKGSEAMERLLRGCSRRVAVLDSRTVAVPLFERRRRFGEPIESERIFDFFLTWLETGSCPDAPPPRTLDSDGKRKPSESSKSPEKPEKPTRRGRGVARAARRSE